MRLDIICRQMSVKEALRASRSPATPQARRKRLKEALKALNLKLRVDIALVEILMERVSALSLKEWAIRTLSNMREILSEAQGEGEGESGGSDSGKGESGGSDSGKGSGSGKGSDWGEELGAAWAAAAQARSVRVRKAG